MRAILVFIFTMVFMGGLRAQSNFEMGYVHPLLNQSFSSQLNSSPSRDFTVLKFLTHSWLGVFANINQKYAITLTYGNSNFDVRYSDAYLLEHADLSNRFSKNQLVHEVLMPAINFHVSVEKKYYEKNRYTLWLGLGLNYVDNPWLHNRRYITGKGEKEIGKNSWYTYESRLFIGKGGNKVVLPFSVYANHKFIYKKREVCIRTGFQFILPQKIDVTLNNEYVFNVNQYTSTVSIPGSVMFYTGVQLNRVLRFRNFGARAKQAFENSLWILPKKLDEPNE